MLVHQGRVGPAVDEKKGWGIRRCCGLVIAVKELCPVVGTVDSRHFGRWVKVAVVVGRIVILKQWLGLLSGCTRVGLNHAYLVRKGG